MIKRSCDSDTRKSIHKCRFRACLLDFLIDYKHRVFVVWNSTNAKRVHVKMEIYITSLCSFISHYKTTLLGRVHVLFAQNKTSALLFCALYRDFGLEHCTKSQGRYYIIEIPEANKPNYRSIRKRSLCHDPMDLHRTKVRILFKVQRQPNPTLKNI